MNRDELECYTQLQNTFDEILAGANFRKVKTESLSGSKGQVNTWERSIDGTDYVFLVSGEDDPAHLISPPTPKVQWSKFDLIRLLHADSDWNTARHLVESGEVLGNTPLTPLTGTRRIELAQEIRSLPGEDRLLHNADYAREYARQLMQMEARRGVQRFLDERESAQDYEDLALLPDDEFNEKLGVVNWNTLWEDTSTERWLVSGFLCAGRGHMLYAPTGIGKSLLLLEVAARLASGRSVWGMPPQEPVRVLYIDLENSPKGDIKPRLEAMGFNWADLGNLVYLSFPALPSLNHQAGGETLAAAIERLKPDLVIFDTFSRFLDADENLARTAQDFYRFTGQMLKKQGIAFIRLDHSGKNPAMGARGNSAKGDDVDLIWFMSEGASIDTFTLKNEKQRIPTSEPTITLVRKEEPLRHEKLSDGYWATLLAEAAKFDAIVDLVRTLVEDEPKHTLARTRTWNDLREECKVIKASRAELFQAIEFYKDYEMLKPANE